MFSAKNADFKMVASCFAAFALGLALMFVGAYLHDTSSAYAEQAIAPMEQVHAVAQDNSGDSVLYSSNTASADDGAVVIDDEANPLASAADLQASHESINVEGILPFAAGAFIAIAAFLILLFAVFLRRPKSSFSK